MDEEWGTLKFRTLAEQLRSYRTPAHLLGEDDNNENGTGVQSSVGIPESAALSTSDSRFRFEKKRAAVLICLFQNDEGDYRVFLTKRGKGLSSHSGEVALPGGKRDEEDADDTATALREAKEEIGLDPSVVRVVTYLEPFLSKHLLKVAPVVALLPDRNKFNPVPSPGEVDAIFDAPLEMFLKDEQHCIEERDWMGYKYQIHYFDFEFKGEKYLIWGMTAAILIRCASVIYQRSPNFVESHPDFTSITNHAPGQDPKL